MSELAALLKQVLPHTKFRTRDGTVYLAEGWQDAIARSRKRLHKARGCPQGLRSEQVGTSTGIELLTTM